MRMPPIDSREFSMLRLKLKEAQHEKAMLLILAIMGWLTAITALLIGVL